MESEDLRKMMIEQYKLAIDARNKLNENFHKWMTFYYVANGAILVAITSLANKSYLDDGILFLSIFGILICIFWNLSCKGYYYWSKSWIDIIINYETNLFKDDNNLKVYSVFSSKVANAEVKYSILCPNKPANISTPKLTMFFSFSAIVCWLVYSIYRFIFIQYVNSCYIGFKYIIVIFFIIILILIYSLLLPKYANSRDRNIHILV